MIYLQNLKVVVWVQLQVLHTHHLICCHTVMSWVLLCDIVPKASLSQLQHHLEVFAQLGIHFDAFALVCFVMFLVELAWIQMSECVHSVQHTVLGHVCHDVICASAVSTTNLQYA